MLPIVILVSVLAVCGTAVYLVRSRPSTTAAAAVEPVATEALKVLREVVGDFTTALTRITAPDREPPAPNGYQEQQPASMPDLDWDPTDADPRYMDPEFAPLVPNGRMYANDAPPPITHPLGIPGLETPFADLGRRFAPNIEIDPDYVKGNGQL